MKAGKMKILSGITLIALVAAAASLHAPALAQNKNAFTLSGRVYDGTTGKSVENAVVMIPALKIKTLSGRDGSYAIDVPGAGSYTVIVNSTSYSLRKINVEVRGSEKRDLTLTPISAAGGIIVAGERDLQRIGRQTMTAQQMNEVPASFGDSVSALTSLAGVSRTESFFGPLVIRGADPFLNRYYIDDIPVYNPQHFGGLHSVISNDLISEVDLYASAFPAQFGGAIGSVININTIDEAKNFGGVANIGLISTNLLLKGPIKMGSADESASPEEKNKGYWMAAGRYGYLSVLVPFVYKLITGEKMSSIPEYWDYQFKAKYAFTPEHSLTMLVMGSNDKYKEIGERTEDEDVDPMVANYKIKSDLQSHSGGLYYTWQPVSRIQNTLIGYGALITSRFSANLSDPRVAEVLKEGFNVRSKPNTYGIKNKTKIEWWKDHAEFRMALEAAWYQFKTDGVTLAVTRDITYDPDWTDQSLFRRVALGRTILNRTLGGYAENKFSFGGLILVPGVRIDYLDRTGDINVDPRGMVSYEFPSGTTLSAAGGRYSSFIQTNPYVFNFSPLIASRRGFRPDRSIHRSVGIEQKISLLSLKLEGFSNIYYNLFEVDPIIDIAGNVIQEGRNTGRQKAYGFEATLKLDREENVNGLFGWVNYTYTRSTRKTNVSAFADEFGDAHRFMTYGYEQKHALKLVAGYTLGKHTLSARFQYFSSFPYTPATGSVENPAGRFVPTYAGTIRNSKHFPADHRLDLRYSYKSLYSWGQVSWYFEVINVYNHQSVEYSWNYYRPYGPGNPRQKKLDGLAFVPNFGVEIKF